MTRNKKTSPSKSLRQISGRSVALIAGLVVLIVGLSASSLLSNAVANQAERDFDNRLRYESRALASYYKARMQTYGRLLYAGVSTQKASGALTDAGMKRFYETMRIPEQYPALIGIGYVSLVNPDETGAFEEAMRKETGEDFHVTPEEGVEGKRGIITYLEPYTEANQRAHGFDMYTEPSRHRAMIEARDSGQVSLSAPVHLVQDAGTANEGLLGVLMYHPVYRSGAQIETIDQRKEAIEGYLYVVLRPGDILANYTAENTSEGVVPNVALDDITHESSVHLYGEVRSVDSRQGGMAYDEEVEAFGRRWSLSVSDKITLLNRFYGPASIFVFGGIMSAFLALVVYAALQGRFARVHREYQKEVQRTKDELLALASHQLRTPASGVKQYVGMLTSGIMGELTSTQLSIAQKAYDANERQIQIINELLYVSKADAGELHIELAEMDLTEVVRTATDTLEEQARAKEIKLVFTARKPRVVSADRRYISMVVENLISNAIKYSYPKHSVRISLHEDEGRVSLDVKDEGVGIAKEDVHRLFNKFDRIPNPLSYSEGGSGLGLFLARQLALAHGGDIEVESEEDKGSTFTLTLPKNPNISSAKVDIKR